MKQTLKVDDVYFELFLDSNYECILTRGKDFDAIATLQCVYETDIIR